MKALIGPIEDGIPIPPKKQGVSPNGWHLQRYRLKELKVGQSRLIRPRRRGAYFHFEIALPELRLHVSQAVCQTAKATGGKFTVRVLKEGVRVWRIK